MNRDEVKELHYIAPLENVQSILQRGILSHTRAAKVTHSSIAMEKIQARRVDKQIPRARRLHEYVNLYFDAHNPMLSKVREHNDLICVLRLDMQVLDMPEVLVTTCNAASGYARFLPVAEGLAALDSSRLFARYWNHPDEFEKARHRREKCAEVLVPDLVPSSFITGAYVANQRALEGWQVLGTDLPAVIRNGFFF